MEGPAGPVVCWKPEKARSALAPCLRDIANNEILPGDRLSCRGPHLVVERMDSALLRHLAVPICLNRANEIDLMSIRGIGPGLARRIVTFRKNHGDFATNESLLLVPGIGPGLLQRIRPRLLDSSQCWIQRASAASMNSLTHPPNP
ncbi:MAG: helix-hairpin-helix domain-containing protein [Deltaproteobacteria bacterium]|nr:helix-hairpin-helix domain-containing protein [Deltaproteobacteria bacterium]